MMIHAVIRRFMLRSDFANSETTLTIRNHTNLLHLVLKYISALTLAMHRHA
jgi:hypothetical protein